MTPVQLVKKPRTAADFPRPERNQALEPDDAQPLVASTAEKIVQLPDRGNALRRRGGQRHLASGGSQAFRQAIHVIFAGKASGQFFRENVEKFHLRFFLRL